MGRVWRLPYLNFEQKIIYTYASIQRLRCPSIANRKGCIVIHSFLWANAASGLMGRDSQPPTSRNDESRLAWPGSSIGFSLVSTTTRPLDTTLRGNPSERRRRLARSPGTQEAGAAAAVAPRQQAMAAQAGA